jgi:hypothetical protein
MDETADGGQLDLLQWAWPVAVHIAQSPRQFNPHLAIPIDLLLPSSALNLLRRVSGGGTVHSCVLPRSHLITREEVTRERACACAAITLIPNSINPKLYING